MIKFNGEEITILEEIGLNSQWKLSYRDSYSYEPKLYSGFKDKSELDVIILKKEKEYVIRYTESFLSRMYMMYYTEIHSKFELYHATELYGGKNVRSKIDKRIKEFFYEDVVGISKGEIGKYIEIDWNKVVEIKEISLENWVKKFLNMVNIVCVSRKDYREWMISKIREGRLVEDVAKIFKEYEESSGLKELCVTTCDVKKKECVSNICEVPYWYVTNSVVFMGANAVELDVGNDFSGVVIDKIQKDIKSDKIFWYHIEKYTKKNIAHFSDGISKLNCVRIESKKAKDATVSIKVTVTKGFISTEYIVDSDDYEIVIDKKDREESVEFFDKYGITISRMKDEFLRKRKTMLNSSNKKKIVEVINLTVSEVENIEKEMKRYGRNSKIFRQVGLDCDEEETLVEND